MTYSWDPCKFVAGILTLLLIFGVVGFTPVAVGIILLLTQTELKFTWEAS